MMLDALKDFCVHQGLEKTYWVAYSGGLDSHVLLSLCAKLRASMPLKLRAIHVNHGLSAQADTWAAHCAQTCAAEGIDFTQQRIHVQLRAGKSLEETARELRYAIFAQCLAQEDILLTAHQEDDQAETMLLQLLRGAGPKGLAAMPLLKPLGKGWQGRPLLAFPRAVLRQYADENQLKWVEDESNAHLTLTRNYIRQAIWPLLKKRWPTVGKVISRSAAHCAEAQQLLEQVAMKELDAVCGTQPQTLSVKKLLLRSLAMQRLILRAFLQSHNYPLPDQDRMQAIQQNVLTARWDANPVVCWQGVELRRYRDDLYVMPALPKHHAHQIIPWALSVPLFLPDIGKLHALPTRGKGLCAGIETIFVRFRQGGEVLSVPGRGRHTLKNLFQEWNIPTWERDRIPLLYVDDVIAAIPGFFLSAPHRATDNQAGYEIVFEKN